MLRIDVEAHSYEEAVKIIESKGYKVWRNITMSWKRAGSPILDKDFDSFAKKQIKSSRIKDLPGIGLMVTIMNGRKDRRYRPYIYTDSGRPKGRLPMERCYEIRKADDDELIVLVTGTTRKKAIKVAKELMPEVKADLYIEIVYRIKDGNGIVGTLEYSPSPSTKIGRYVFIGNELSTFSNK